MPSGLVPLTEALKHGSEQQLGSGIVETIIQWSAMIPRMNWVSFEGKALKHEMEGTLPTSSFRNVNEGYTKSWGSDTEHYWGVAILGGEVGIDIFEENVVANQKSEMKKQLKKHAKANSLRFDWEVFHGTGSVASKGFKGLDTLVDEGWGQKVLNAAGGGALTLAKLDETIDAMLKGKPDEMRTISRIRRKITELARTTVSGVSLIDVGTDVFGKKVTMYDDVPIILTQQAQNSSGSIVPLLDYNEDPGDGAFDCTSIWFLRHGEDELTGIAGKTGSFQAKTWGELESAPQYMARFEWYPGVAILDPYAVARLYGITNA
jgi:hypothetical protein